MIFISLRFSFIERKHKRFTYVRIKNSFIHKKQNKTSSVQYFAKLQFYSYIQYMYLYILWLLWHNCALDCDILLTIAFCQTILLLFIFLFLFFRLFYAFWLSSFKLKANSFCQLLLLAQGRTGGGWYMSLYIFIHLYIYRYNIYIYILYLYTFDVYNYNFKIYHTYAAYIYIFINTNIFIYIFTYIFLYKCCISMYKYCIYMNLTHLLANFITHTLRNLENLLH